MYEFVFFDDGLQRRFLEVLARHGVQALAGDPDVALSVGVDEGVDDAVLDQIEQEYDHLLDEQARITEAAEPESVARVGVQYTDADGGIGMVRLNPQLTQRLLTVLSYEELQSLVQQVVDASRETDRPLCKP